MTLLDPAELDDDATAYRLFGFTRDKVSWHAADVIRSGGHRPGFEHAELAWRTASRGYYAEQAGLVAAARLATLTEDAPFRFSLALAAADEARHADAFYQYAKARGGEPEDCQELLEPLDSALTALPHLGRALVHTMLEGFAADEFLIFQQVFAGDALADLYHYVRRDENHHVAIGLSYLARASRTDEAREQWDAHGGEWHAIGCGLTFLDPVCVSLGGLTGRDPADLKAWFLRRHTDRLKAAGLGSRWEFSAGFRREHSEGGAQE